MELKVGQTYICEKTIRHPNIGIIFKKGDIYPITEITDEHVRIGNMYLYTSVFEKHFKRLDGPIDISITRLVELLNAILDNLYGMYNAYSDIDEFGDFVVDTFTKDEAKVFSLEGWFGNNDELEEE